MQVVAEDLVLNYEVVGDKNKPAVLFLHGWADSGRTFSKLAADFSKNYYCVLLDLPGFGNSETPKQAINLLDFSRIVAEFLEKIDIKPYAIIGHSNGGAVAINAVSSKLIEPKKLILLASSGVRENSKLKKTIYKIIAKPTKVLVSVLPKNTRHKVKKKAYENIGSDFFVAENMKETFKNIVNYDVKADAAKITIPTLMLYGDTDTVTPPEDGKILAGLINSSKYYVISDAGHFLHHDQPKTTANKIEAFLI